MAMKRPAAARQADAPMKRPVQGQAKPKLEKPSGSSSSSTMNRPAAAQPAQGEDVVQSGRKVKRQAEAKAVAKPRLEPPTASSQGAGLSGRKKHLCHGTGDLPCVFSVQTSGAAARYQDASCQCPWCNDAFLQTALATSRGRGQLKRSLKFFWANNKEIFNRACQCLPNTMKPYLPLQALGFPPAFHSEAAMQKATSTPQGVARLVVSLRKRQAVDPENVQKALEAIPEELQETLRDKLSKEPRRIRQARARQEVEHPEEKWTRLLQHRQRLRQPVDTEEDEKDYQTWLAEDRGRVQKKFFPGRPREVKHTGPPLDKPSLRGISCVCPSSNRTAAGGLLLQEVWTRSPGGTYKIHLLTMENKAVGCGWQPSIDKAQDLNPLDHRSEPHCYHHGTRVWALPPSTLINASWANAWPNPQSLPLIFHYAIGLDCLVPMVHTRNRQG